jgi:hypothetical protein
VPRQNIVGEPILVYFSVTTAGRSEITGLPNASLPNASSSSARFSSDRLAHEPAWWGDLVGSARWGRIFHVIR